MPKYDKTLKDKMSVDMMDLTMDDFIPGVIDIVTAGAFMDMTEDAQIIFI